MGSDTLIADLGTIVGAGNVVTDRAACLNATRDLFPWPEPAAAEAVVRPGSSAETARVLVRLHQASRNVVPRGAGMSYTGGVSPAVAAVVVDTARLNTIEIVADDRYAVVGAGCTWQAVFDALKPHGLRAAQINPISGSVSTVGGTASQSQPGGTHGVLGLGVVLADGTLVQTGAHARAGRSGFSRNFGPDLTGLFLGDCGAFGVKTEVVLQLVPERACAFASFTYSDPYQLIADFISVQRQGLVTRAMAIDPQKGESAGRVDLNEAAKIIGATIANAKSALRAMRDVAQLARGRHALARGEWSLHLTVEGVDEASAESQLAIAKRQCATHGHAIDPIVPRSLRAKPYSVRGFVGMDGERWVPIHGMLPLSKAAACFDALETYFATAAAGMIAAQITRGTMVSAAGSYVTIEPMLYWPDALDPIHLEHLSDRNRQRFGDRLVNDAARALVLRLRNEVREIFAAFDAVHAQTGRYYHYLDHMSAGGQELVARIKQAVDGHGRMNPGALGLTISPAKTPR